MSSSTFLDALWTIQARERLSDVELSRELGISHAMVSLLKSGKRNGGRRFIHAALRRWPELIGYLLSDESEGTRPSTPRSAPQEPAEVSHGPPRRCQGSGKPHR